MQNFIKASGAIKLWESFQCPDIYASLHRLLGNKREKENADISSMHPLWETRKFMHQCIYSWCLNFGSIPLSFWNQLLIYLMHYLLKYHDIINFNGIHVAQKMLPYFVSWKLCISKASGFGISARDGGLETFL